MAPYSVNGPGLGMPVMPSDWKSTCWRVVLSWASTAGQRVAPLRAARFSCASRSRARACASVGLASSAMRMAASSSALRNSVHHCAGTSAPAASVCMWDCGWRSALSAATVATGCGPGT
ncbi:hypothetical protein D3C72_1916420 [compost metagenome]